MAPGGVVAGDGPPLIGQPFGRKAHHERFLFAGIYGAAHQGSNSFQRIRRDLATLKGLAQLGLFCALHSGFGLCGGLLGALLAIHIIPNGMRTEVLGR
jgi:hypothetical protein